MLLAVEKEEGITNQEMQLYLESLVYRVESLGPDYYLSEQAITLLHTRTLTLLFWAVITMTA